ncbi:MAG TPA: metallophosphoesterase [Polyangia bacterium]|jgi:3',5'-cyclic AMP phosphodiesterase CpdA|nr:metallophosphoesterase [Polyangia bacterium]
MLDRRDILKLMGVGGVVFASGLTGAAKKSANDNADFFFLQLSDTHWGYSGVSNPEADVTLKKAIATINAVAATPDFIVFTGDLTHTTDDLATRNKRMTEFKEIVSGLKTKALHLMPGEHDAAKDRGGAFRAHFGETHTAFDHKGVHFVTLDNVSDPEGAVGAAQIDWLAADLKKVGPDARVVVFTHRPLFDLYPQWEWSTKDGAKVIDVLMSHKHVTVFYGHIHQEHHHQTGHITHHAARSLVFPLPVAGSVPKKVPLAWDPAAPFAGLGYRRVDLGASPAADPRAKELPVVKPAS